MARALICGSSKGIGREAAIRLAEDGWSCVLLARNAQELEKVKSSLAGEGHSIVAHDVSDRAGLKKKILNELEKGPITTLINNTGGPKSGAIVDANEEEFLSTFQNHLLVNHQLVQLLLPGMKEKKSGRVINVISTSVKIPLPNLGVSNTIRAAVASWAKTMANELGPFGITVNNVLPGFTATERLDELKKATADRMKKSPEDIEKDWINTIPLKRLAHPREIAEAIAFLASPQASYISGINLPVDGGRLGTL